MAEKMADNNAWRKKEAKRKAGPSGQKEKQRKEAESSKGTRRTPEEGGQNMAHEEQPQGGQEQGPEEGARGQWRVDTKDLQEGWETIKEIDKVLGSNVKPTFFKERLLLFSH